MIARSVCLCQTAQNFHLQSFNDADMTSKILVITDNAEDAQTLRDALCKATDGPFRLEWKRTLSESIERLAESNVDAILVDLALPDSEGIETFDRLFAASPQTPIMTLCADDDEPLAIEMVEYGSQGYLSRGHFKNYLVPQGLRNMILRKAVEENLLQEKARAEIVLNSISDAVICTDISGNVDYLNVAAEDITGWSAAQAMGKPIADIFKIIDSETRLPIRNTVELVLQKDEVMGLPANTLLIRQDGSEAAIEDSASPIHDLSGNLTGAVIVFHDVSETKAMAVKMTHLAHHDFLTNLPNRVLLNDRIAQAITSSKRNGAKLAVLFLDLDNFKHINDSLGHATGDMLLKSVTNRLVDCVRDSDTVSRQGGDEFVILLSESKDESNASLTAEKIITSMTLPHLLSRREFHITTSIGISIYPTDGLDAGTLIKNADTAMYHAKDNGRNNYQFFRNHMNTRAVERQFIESSLRQAIERDEFVLYYQPKLSLRTGAITGMEALLRWAHPKWGMVQPERFLQIAEESGLIVTIGRWVLREACRQAKQWLDSGIPKMSIAVNISALEFRQPGFFDGVQKVLEDTGLDPQMLELEITESVLMRDAQSSTEILSKLKNLGVQLAVDDFGTGFSSLSYLQQFPIDVLKIDRSFVSEIKSISDDGFIVSAVIGMGNSLKLRVVAEGIENEVQLAFLQVRDCEEGQGYLFSPPVAAAQITAMLKSGISSKIDF